MEHMTDMKLSKQEKKDKSEPSALSEDNYPYGLTLHLDSESSKKLGITLKNAPEAGAKVMIEAVASVARVSVEDDGDGKEVSVNLQIEKMSMVPSKGKSNEEIFFDNDNS